MKPAQQNNEPLMITARHEAIGKIVIDYALSHGYGILHHANIQEVYEVVEQESGKTVAAISMRSHRAGILVFTYWDHIDIILAQIPMRSFLLAEMRILRATSDVKTICAMCGPRFIQLDTMRAPKCKCKTLKKLMEETDHKIITWLKGVSRETIYGDIVRKIALILIAQSTVFPPWHELPMPDDE